MHPPILRMALVLALASAGCDSKAPATSSGPLLPNYIDRGIVILDANPQRPNYGEFDWDSYGDQPSHTFRLQNAEKKTVTITSVQPACGCAIVTLSSPGQHGLHQSSSHTTVLHGWINRDRADAGNRITLPKKIAADHPAVVLRDD